MGARPESIILSHPANWTAFKLDLLREATALADLNNVSTTTEPVAAQELRRRPGVNPGAKISPRRAS